MKPRPTPLTRRNVLQMLTAAPIAYLLAACGLRSSATQNPAPTRSAATLAPTVPGATTNPTATTPAEVAPSPVAQILPPTPACGDDDDEPTLAQTEGPYYTPNTPERASLLEDGLTGTRLLVTGYVLDTQCQPIAQALIDFWHCDSAGVYDNAGYKLRGHQFTNAQGQYTLTTIKPGLYPGRTRHIHVKVQAPNQPVLTTQLYFPDEPQNASDGIYNAALLMDVQPATDGEAATFNFVLNLG